MFRAPGLELVAFSPDGSLAIGRPSRFSQRRLAVVSVLTGEVLMHLDGTAEWAVPWREMHLVPGRPLYGPHPVIRAD